LKQYDILDIYRRILSKAESRTRLRTLHTIIDMDVVDVICTICEFNFSLKFFEILSEKVSNTYFGDDEYQIDQLEKYAKIGGQLINRIFGQLVTEDAIAVENGIPTLIELPCWFERIQFLLPLAIIIIREHPDYIDYEALQILMFSKETFVKKESDNIEHSLALFGNENEEDEDHEFCDNYQAIILTKFLKTPSPKLTKYLQSIRVSYSK